MQPHLGQYNFRTEGHNPKTFRIQVSKEKGRERCDYEKGGGGGLRRTLLASEDGRRGHEPRKAGSLEKVEEARREILPWSLQKGVIPLVLAH